jgi:hypothetical protein
MKETMELDIELESSSVLDGDGTRPFWRASPPDFLLLNMGETGDSTELAYHSHVRTHVRFAKLCAICIQARGRVWLACINRSV